MTKELSDMWEQRTQRSCPEPRTAHIDVCKKGNNTIYFLHHENHGLVLKTLYVTPWRKEVQPITAEEWEELKEKLNV